MIVLARAGLGTVKEITDMDLLSFQSAADTLGRVLERESPPQPADKQDFGAPLSPGGKPPKLTKDQQNLQLLSRVKVDRAR